VRAPGGNRGGGWMIAGRARRGCRKQCGSGQSGMDVTTSL